MAQFDSTAAGKGFTLYRPADRKARHITALLEDGTGEIWCGTEGGLYRLRRTGEGWVMRFVDIGMPTAEFDDTVIQALLLDRGGSLWIGGPSGLYRRSGEGRCQHYSLRKIPGRTHITALLEDRQGRLWVGVWEEGLFRISIKPESSEPSMEKLYTKKEGLAGVPIFSLLQTSDGQLWAGGTGGLSRYISDGERDEFERFTDVNGLTQNEVGALGEDRAGNLWVGSTGVNKISRGGFVTYGKPDGLASRSVQSVFDDHEGKLCAVTERNSVSCFDGRRFHSVSPNVPSYVKYWG